MKACFQTLGGTPLKRAQFIQALANYGALPEDAESSCFSDLSLNVASTLHFLFSDAVSRLKVF